MAETFMRDMAEPPCRCGHGFGQHPLLACIDCQCERYEPNADPSAVAAVRERARHWQWPYRVPVEISTWLEEVIADRAAMLAAYDEAVKEWDAWKRKAEDTDACAVVVQMNMETAVGARIHELEIEMDELDTLMTDMAERANLRWRQAGRTIRRMREEAELRLCRRYDWERRRADRWAESGMEAIRRLRAERDRLRSAVAQNEGANLGVFEERDAFRRERDEACAARDSAVAEARRQHRVVDLLEQERAALRQDVVAAKAEGANEVLDWVDRFKRDIDNRNIDNETAELLRSRYPRPRCPGREREGGGGSDC